MEWIFGKREEYAFSNSLVQSMMMMLLEETFSIEVDKFYFFFVVVVREERRHIQTREVRRQSYKRNFVLKNIIGLKFNGGALPENRP